MNKLWLSDKAAVQLKEVPQAMKEATDEKAEPGPDLRALREQERAETRSRILREIEEAKDTDKKVRGLVSAYNEACQATVADRDIHAARKLALRDAEKALVRAQEALAKARQEHEDAASKHNAAKGSFDEVHARVEAAADGIRRAQAAVVDGLLESNIAWEKLTKPRRKDFRDRLLKKNAARIAGVSDGE